MGWDKAGVQCPGLWVPVLAVLLGACQAIPIPDSSPLLHFGSQVRHRYLYTDDVQETETHLEIRADGTVGGSARQTPESECGGTDWAQGGGAGGLGCWGREKGV